MAASTRNLLNLLKFTEFISFDGCTGTAGLSWKGKLDRSSLAAFFPWWAVNNCWNNLCWCLIFIKCLFLCAYICLTDCCDYSPVSQWPFHYTLVLNVSGHDHIYKKKKSLDCTHVNVDKLGETIFMRMLNVVTLPLLMYCTNDSIQITYVLSHSEKGEESCSLEWYINAGKLVFKRTLAFQSS